MKKIFVSAVCFFSALLFFTACSLESLLPPEDAQKTKFYDLSLPKPLEAGDFQVVVRAFTGLARHKMVFRDVENTVLYDEFNRWVSPPEQLLMRNVSVSFSNAPQKGNIPAYILSANVLDCSFDIANKQVILLIRYVISNYGDSADMISGVKIYKQDVSEVSPDVFAEIVSSCAEQFAKDIFNVISEKRRVLN